MAPLTGHGFSCDPEAAQAQGITLSPLSRYYLQGPGQPGLVLGYAGADEDEINRAGTWLSQAWLAARQASAQVGEAKAVSSS